MRRFRTGILLLTVFLLLSGQAVWAAKRDKTTQPLKTEKETKGKALDWFYRTALKVDRFMLRGVDTAYIGLPEHSWRVALNSGIIGINSSFGAENVINPFGHDMPNHNVYLNMRTKPTVNLGFNIGLRGFGFGYSWDLIDSRAKTLNFSFGGKFIGVEFLRQSSSNIRAFYNKEEINDVGDGIERVAPYFMITNTTLSVWYALNSAHYNHNAAIKQSYIQRKSAGSLLVQIHYASTQVELDDRLHEIIGNLLGCETHQVGVGLGYGINYTPNKGKVVIHASAMAQLICLSHNLVTQYDKLPVSVGGKDTTMVVYSLYRVQSRYPVHVTGTMRAAVSWEINKWVHLSAWGQANNTRFMAQAAFADINLRNWNWQANLSVAVRLGAGNDRIRQRLGAEQYNRLTQLPPPAEQDLVKLPNWFTRWFFSPKL